MIRQSLFPVAVILLNISTSVHAQNFLVSNLSDSGAGSLRQAILDANAYSDSSSSTSITFQSSLNGTINLSGMLPALTQPRGMSINGAGASIVIDGGATSNTTGDRVFFVGISSDIANSNLPATVNTSFSISNLTIQNGNARGGNGGNYGGGGAGLGGGLFLNAGNLTLSNVMFNSNRAVGGQGRIGGFGGGGGGGMGGNGGEYLSGGGGGFGLGADGGGPPPELGQYAPGHPGVLIGAASGGSGGALNGAPGGAGGINGGGGGGAWSPGGGGGGGVGGGIGVGGSSGGYGGYGGFGGGGGGGVVTPSIGGIGGFGGGGGGAFPGFSSIAGRGGFGGGGGGGSSGSGAAGFGAEPGNSTTLKGGDGLGTGGAIFVRDGSFLSIVNGSLLNSTVARGNPLYSNMGQAIFLGSNVSISVSSGTMTIADTLGGDGGVLGYSGTGGNADGGLIKAGAGTLILTGANNYSGGTTIDAGTLLVNNLTGSGTGRANEAGVGGVVTVNNSAALGGNGFIAGTVMVNTGGIITPGESTGFLTINNNIFFHPDSVMLIEINGTTAGTQYDQLRINGGVNLNSPMLNLNLGFNANPGDSFFLLVNDGSDSIQGSFTGLPQDSIINLDGQAFQIRYDGDFNSGSLSNGNDIVIVAIAVPEPTTIALCSAVIAGSLGIWFRRTRRRRLRKIKRQSKSNIRCCKYQCLATLVLKTRVCSEITDIDPLPTEVPAAIGVRASHTHSSRSPFPHHSFPYPVYYGSG